MSLPHRIVGRQPQPNGREMVIIEDEPIGEIFADGSLALQIGGSVAKLNLTATMLTDLDDPDKDFKRVVARLVMPTSVLVLICKAVLSQVTENRQRVEAAYDGDKAQLVSALALPEQPSS